MSGSRLSVAALRREMKALATPERAVVSQRFFKTGAGEYGAGDRFMGIAVPHLRTLARRYDALPLRDVSRLLQSRWHEERQLALFILTRQYARGTAAVRDVIHRLYLGSTAHINNWDLVDCSAEHIVGAHLEERDRRILTKLAKSKDVWERRIAMIATFGFIKRGQFGDALHVARMLVNDPHDLIHKAVGWMLREIGKRDRQAAEAFLQEHGPTMPRTMLRYAIERFPPKLRQQYLAA